MTQTTHQKKQKKKASKLRGDILCMEHKYHFSYNICILQLCEIYIL